jgi:hypothetical protein
MKLHLLAFFVFPILGFSQLLNGGMENYTLTPSDTVPTDWTADTYWSTAVGKSTDAHSGNYSFAINTWYSYSPGRFVNGDGSSLSLLFDWMYAGTPSTTKYSQLSGWYKYIDTVYNDSAIVKVLLKKWNTAQNKIDSVALGEAKLPFADVWTNFTVNINDLAPGVSPDSVVVFFMSFDYLKGTQPICQSNLCRYLYLDDLSLTGTLSVADNKKQSELKCWNFQRELFVTSSLNEKQSAQLFCAEGKFIRALTIQPGKNVIDLNNIEAGFYFLRIENASSNFKFCVE